MNTKYSIKKVWYYLLCMIMTLQLIACTEETHESYTAAPEVEDIYIDQLEELINNAGCPKAISNPFRWPIV